MHRGSRQHAVPSTPWKAGSPNRGLGTPNAAKAGRFACVGEKEPMTAEKVLIVDDERLVRWSLRQKCEEWGYLVSEAESGTAGLRLARNETPDLVLLDVR